MIAKPVWRAYARGMTDRMKVIAVLAICGAVFVGGYSGHALEGFSACPGTTGGTAGDTTGGTVGDTTGDTGSSTGGCPPDGTPGDTSGGEPINSTSEEVPAGGTASTNETVTESDPVGTSVTSPNAGEVTIEERSTTQDPPPSYTFLDIEVSITAPEATAGEPLELVFRIHSSLLEEGVDETNLAIFRNGELVEPCDGTPGTADPNPCVANRAAISEGVELTVLTSSASFWNFGVLEAFDFSGFEPPLKPADDPTLLNTVKAGSSVRAQFSLGGDRGLEIFESPPTSQSVTCSTDETFGPVEGALPPGKKGGGLSYDPETDLYTYTWKTSSNFAKGSCRRLTLHFADDSTHSGYFKFK